MKKKNKVQEVEKILNIKFKNINLLKQALVHRSYLNEHPEFELGHNERLEFLGDAVLEIVVTEYLFLNFTDVAEGDLTNWRSALVNSKMLYKVAQKLEIEDYLYLSKGEGKDKNKKSRQYILANTIEALIGAIYLDAGLKTATKFILQHILSQLDFILQEQLFLDPKSHFQELAQELRGITPHYELLKESGPDHSKLFKVGLYLKDELIATGKGSSKQEAQVEAAKLGLKKLE